MKRILLVEDERLVALSEKRMLEKHDFLVETAHCGESATEQVRSGATPDLILMDIDLGEGMNGTETARWILAQVDLPIVFLTGHAEREMVDRVKGITRYGYVLKGSGEFVLIESINMAFELFQAHREITAKELRLEQLIEEAPVGIFQSWASGSFETVNAEVARMLGFESPKATVAHYKDLRGELYANPRRRDELLARLESEGAVRGFEFEAVGVDGRRLDLRLEAKLFERYENDFLLSGFVVDETSQKAAERAHRKSATDYRCIVNLTQEIIERVDTEGR
ncbi:MAG: response regulator [Spirochaetes bacterium]|jgi:PAS domain S-box-containing protein|nr:response regulator [Spirochaetota bacterium]